MGLNRSLNLTTEPSHPFILPGPHDLRGPCREGFHILEAYYSLLCSWIEHSGKPWISSSKVTEIKRPHVLLQLLICYDHSGIASFEQIVNAATHAFNVDYDLASTLTGFAMVTTSFMLCVSKPRAHMHVVGPRQSLHQ